jgi:hypothetical protein
MAYFSPFSIDNAGRLTVNSNESPKRSLIASKVRSISIQLFVAPDADLLRSQIAWTRFQTFAIVFISDFH